MTETFPLVEKYYSVNGIQLHVVESGPEHGPVLLFLHGFPEFWYGWQKQIPFFASLGYRVIVPDQRGYNYSSKPKGIRPYQIKELMQDVVELIQKLGVEQVFLVGHDWGAIVAWHLAIYFPHYIRRMVIINVPHPLVMRKVIRSRIDQVRRSWYVFFIQLPWLPEKLVSRAGFKLLMNSLQKTSLPGTFSKADFQEYRTAWSQPGSFTAMLNWYRALRFRRKPDATLTSSPISVPVLIIWGKQDAFLRAEMAAKSAEKCSNGQVLLLEDATHWVQHEKPEVVNQAIMGFFSEDKKP